MTRLIEIQKKYKTAMRTRRNQLRLKISEIEKVFKILTKWNIMARLIEIQKKCKTAMRKGRNQLWL